MSLDDLLARYSVADLYRSAYRDNLRASYYEFAKEAWPVIEPATPLLDNWHLGCLCEHLQAVVESQILRLVISMPPGMAKSTFATVLITPWIWTWRPAWRGIFTSYLGPLASRDSGKCRDVLDSRWYRDNFSKPNGWTLSSTQNEKTLYQNTKTGFRQSFAVGTGTGFRGNGVFYDDPLCAADAHNKPERDRVIEWMSQVMSTRINDPKRDTFCCTMQRLHKKDPAAYLEDLGYQVLSLPMEYDPKRSFVTFRIVDGVREVFRSDPRDVAGELLHEERYPLEVINMPGGIREVLGTRGYETQCNQNPSVDGGAIFERPWWRFFRIAGQESAGHKRPRGCAVKVLPSGEQIDEPPEWFELADFDEVYMSIDCAFKDKATSSYVVIGVWARLGKKRFRLDRRRDKMTYTRTKEEIRAVCVLWPQAHKKMVEDKANGSAIIDELQSEIEGIVPRDPGRNSKEARAYAVSPQHESRHVYLLDEAPWLEEYMSELEAFPNGDADDQVDETTQALLEYTPRGEVSRAAALCTSGLNEHGLPFANS